MQVRDDQSQPKDKVLDQNPPGGQGIASAAGVKVTLTVASGPPGTPMPGVLGQACPAAVQALQGAGIPVDVAGDPSAKQIGHGPAAVAEPGRERAARRSTPRSPAAFRNRMRPPVQSRPLGAHAPAAGGLAKAALPHVDGAAAAAVQVFVSNPRGWALTDGDPAQDEAFLAGLRASGRSPRTCTPRCWSTSARRPRPRWNARPRPWPTRCARAPAIGARAVVFHAGSAVDDGYAATALRQVRRGRCCRCSTRSDLGPRLLVEPSAGGGRCLAARVEDLGPYLEAVDWHPWLGVCFDTCHAWAAGHDLATPGGMTATLDALVATVGPDRLALVHANDSRDACGSLRDRHETIGAGSLGEAAFAELLAHPATAGVPVIVETPTTGYAGHAADIATLARLAKRFPAAPTRPGERSHRAQGVAPNAELGNPY